jgi:hypothetical protein
VRVEGWREMMVGYWGVYVGRCRERGIIDFSMGGFLSVEVYTPCVVADALLLILYLGTILFLLTTKRSLGIQLE